MTEREIIRELLAVRGETQTGLAKMLGYKRQSSIGNIFIQRTIQVDVFAKVLDALGCDLIVRSREAVKAPGGMKYVPEWKVREEHDVPEEHEGQEDDSEGDETVSEDPGAYDIGEEELEHALDNIVNIDLDDEEEKPDGKK